MDKNLIQGVSYHEKAGPPRGCLTDVFYPCRKGLAGDVVLTVAAVAAIELAVIDVRPPRTEPEVIDFGRSGHKCLEGHSP